MANFGAPVAQDVNVNPSGGIQTLAGLLSLQQQKQQLQTGAYQQQSAQADAIQKQQAAQEMQAAVPLMRDPVGSGITDATGKPTANAYSIIKSVMPITGDAHYNDMITAASNTVNYKNAWTKLTQDQQSNISSRLAGIAADPKSQTADILDQLDKINDENSGQPQSADINKLTDSARHFITYANANRGPEAVKQVVMGLSRGGVGNTGITGPGGVATPQTATIDTGPNIQAGTVAPALQGGGFTPQTATAKAPGPTQTIPYVAAAAAAGSGAGARATGVAGSDIDRANQVSANIQPSTAAIETTKKIDDLADQVNSGKVADWVSKAAGAAGISPIVYARQLLEKDLGQVKALASQGAQSDQRMGTILSGYPESTSAPQTIHTAMDYIRGSFRQNVARGQQLNEYRTAHPDLTGFQHADDVLTSHVDPLMSEFQSLSTPAARQGFYRRNFTTPQEAQAFKDKVTGVGHVLGP